MDTIIYLILVFLTALVMRKAKSKPSVLFHSLMILGGILAIVIVPLLNAINHSTNSDMGAIEAGVAIVADIAGIYFIVQGIRFMIKNRKKVSVQSNL